MVRMVEPKITIIWLYRHPIALIHFDHSINFSRIFFDFPIWVLISSEAPQRSMAIIASLIAFSLLLLFVLQQFQQFFSR